LCQRCRSRTVPTLPIVPRTRLVLRRSMATAEATLVPIQSICIWVCSPVSVWLFCCRFASARRTTKWRRTSSTLRNSSTQSRLGQATSPRYFAEHAVTARCDHLIPISEECSLRRVNRRSQHSELFGRIAPNVSVNCIGHWRPQALQCGAVPLSASQRRYGCVCDALQCVPHCGVRCSGHSSAEHCDRSMATADACRSCRSAAQCSADRTDRIDSGGLFSGMGRQEEGRRQILCNQEGTAAI
jgi:hypothetical protein